MIVGDSVESVREDIGKRKNLRGAIKNVEQTLDDLDNARSALSDITTHLDESRPTLVSQEPEHPQPVIEEATAEEQTGIRCRYTIGVMFHPSLSPEISGPE
jgi:hypothetical protein